MLTTVMAALAGWITAAIAASGYGGVALMMALESACVPLPSEIIMPFAGSLVASGRLDLWMVATAGALGCNLGSTLAWLVGSRGGRAVVLRWGRRVGLSESALARSEAHFARWGTATVFTSRLLPVVRTFISLPAGIARMPFWRFQIYTFLGSWPWCFALAWIGMRLGEAWDRTPALHSAMHAFDAVVVLGLAGWLGWSLLRRHRNRA